MTRQEMLAAIETALDTQPGTITEGTMLGSVEGWDSVGQLSVMATFDSSIGVVLPPQKIATCKTAAELLDLAADKLN